MHSLQIPDMDTNSENLRKCCAKTRFEFVEMHTNPLDPYLIGIVA